MYTCKYFDIRELVSREWYDYAESRNAVGLLWKAFDENLLCGLDALREMYGPLIVNSWARGGNRSNSGLRAMNCPVGAAMSQHKFGRAIDFISRTITPKQIYDDLVSAGGLKPEFKTTNPKSPWVYINRLEYYPGITWTHIDVMPDASDGSIRVFRA